MLALLALLGCGGSQAPKDLDAAFRRIQLHEARIERADRRLARAQAIGESCAICTVGDEVDASAAAVCAEADALDDADARERCTRATARVNAMNRRERPCSCAHAKVQR